MHTFRRVAKTQPNIAARYGLVTIPAATEIDHLIANLSDEDGRPLIDYWISPLSTLLEPTGAGIQDRRHSSVQWMTSSGAITVAGNRMPWDGSFKLQAGSAAAANPNAFTVIARVKPTSHGVLIGNERNSQLNTGSVTLGVVGILTSAGGDTNVADNAGDLAGVDLVATVSFSTARGVSIRRNGVQTYSNPARTQPNVETQIHIGGLGTSTNRFIGDMGYLLFSLRDLTDPALLHGLAMIEKALVDLG